MFSKEHQYFYDSFKCPLCNFSFIVPKYFIDDKEIRGIPCEKMDISSVAECSKCKGRWNVFSGLQTSNATIIKQQTQILTVPNQNQNVSKSLQEKNEFRIVETGCVEEILGLESRVIDNSRSNIQVTREFTISKEWSQTCTIDYEESTTIGSNIKFGLPKIIDFEVKAEYTIKNKYAVSENSKQSYSEKIILQVPALTKVTIIFQWKLICQTGLIQFQDSNGTEYEVPYKVAVGVTFDQNHIDEKKY